MRRFFSIFKLKPEERIQAGVVLLVIIVLNGLFIWRMHDLFMQEGFGPYWKVVNQQRGMINPFTHTSLYIGSTAR